jgi:DNA-binding NtrC family response regulator
MAKTTDSGPSGAVLRQPAAELRLLLIDDEVVVHRSVGGFLERMGYSVVCADRAEEGLRLFQEQGADVVISDIRMPGMDGLELLDELGRLSQGTEVILITGHGDMDVAVQALRRGAFDFLRKPLKLDELLACLQRTRRYMEVRREKDQIQQRLDALLHTQGGRLDRHEIVGESAAIEAVRRLIAKVAGAERTAVLIEGESGTGKELAARAIHAQSPRAARPFLSVNCAAIPRTLLESELFGHERGAFTDARESRRGLFELGAGGTLFLDEIGDMDLEAQAKILRALEEHRVRRVGGERETAVDVRLISATNQDLPSLIERGAFRQDLYFRLKVFTIRMPPLRERGDDVLLLAYHYLREYNADLRKDIVGLDPTLQALLRRYPFPGNVRELRNLVERAVILCDGPVLGRPEFPDLAEAGPAAAAGELPTLDLAALEEQAIRLALARTSGVQTDAAALLGIGHDALRYRIRKYGIE